MNSKNIVDFPCATTFSGNIYLFHAFDIGDDINLEKIHQIKSVRIIPLAVPKYFSMYSIPLTLESPRREHSIHAALSCRLHNFGALAFVYQIPFQDTLETVRKNINGIHETFLEQSIFDAQSIYDRIRPCISKPKFFQTRSNYSVIQVYPHPTIPDISTLQKEYGSIITSMVRFETEMLSEAQKNEILARSMGYFRGDLIVIDTDAAFVYDDEYDDLLPFFEFATIQHLELRYFDRLLEQELNKIYEGKGRSPGLKSYLPFIDVMGTDPIDQLGKLRVDISVITERLDSSIKLAGDPYVSELYDLLVKKLDLKNWRSAIDHKLNIIRDVQETYQDKINIIREDMLSVLIIILIFIEVVTGILHYFK